MQGYNFGRRVSQNNCSNNTLATTNNNTINCVNNATATTNGNNANCINNSQLASNSNILNDLLPEQVAINTCTNLNCFLQNYIGKKCSCEFIVGDNLVKRTGTLSEVGNNFLVLTSLNNGTNILFCNTSNLIFVKIE